MHGTSSDEALIERIADRDQLAMRALFGRHRTALYRWLVRLVGDTALAEDLLSDVFLDVWRQAAVFEGRSSAPRGREPFRYRPGWPSVLPQSRGYRTGRSCRRSDHAGRASSGRPAPWLVDNARRRNSSKLL